MKNDFREGLQNILDESVRTETLPCLSVMIYRKGEEKLFLTAGYKNLERKEKVGRDTIYHLYSMSKIVTAAAVMKLVEDGRLSLYDPVYRYLPEYKEFRYFQDGEVHTTTESHPLRICHLLTMESGLGYGDSSESGKTVAAVMKELVHHAEDGKGLSTREAARAFSQCIGAFKPGEGWLYGVSADILGAVIEEVTHKTFGDYLRETVFEPLGMYDTGFYVPEEKRSRMADRYTTNHEGHLVLDDLPALGIPYYFKEKCPFESGGAGLVSTPDDYLKFATMLLHKGTYGGGRILREKTVAYMASPVTEGRIQKDFEHNFNSHRGYRYAHLVQCMCNPGYANELTPLDTFGWNGWTGGNAFICPEEDTVVLLFGQKSNSSGNHYTFQVRNYIFSHLEDLDEE